MGRYRTSFTAALLAAICLLAIGCGEGKNKETQSPETMGTPTKSPPAGNKQMDEEPDTSGGPPNQGSPLGEISSRPVARYEIDGKPVRVSKAQLEEYMTEFKAFHSIFFPVDGEPTTSKLWPFLLAGWEADMAGIVVTDPEIDAKILWAFSGEENSDYVENVLDFAGVSMERFREYVRLFVAAEKLDHVFSDSPFLSPETTWERYKKLESVYEFDYISFSHADFLDEVKSDVPEERRFAEAMKKANAKAQEVKKMMIDHVREVNKDKMDAIKKKTNAEMDEAVEAEKNRLLASNPDLGEKALKRQLQTVRKKFSQSSRTQIETMNSPMGKIGFDAITKRLNLEVEHLGPIPLDFEGAADSKKPREVAVPVAGTRATPEERLTFMEQHATLSLMDPGQVGGVFRDDQRGECFVVKLIQRAIPTYDEIDPVAYRKSDKMVVSQEVNRLKMVVNFYHLSLRFQLKDLNPSRTRAPGAPGAALEQKEDE